MHHGWVWSPLGDAWADLSTTRRVSDLAGSPASGPVSRADLQSIQRIIAEMLPGVRLQIETSMDLWELVKKWSQEEIERFEKLAGLPELEVLFRCKEIATAAEVAQQPPDGQEAGQNPTKDNDDENEC
jgi:hypothetical protein